MTDSQSSFLERFASISGLLVLIAALMGMGVLALGFLGRETALLTAEGVIVILLVALGMRELGARIGTKRTLNDLRAEVAEGKKRNRLLKLTEAATGIGHWRLDLSSNEVFWSDGTFAIHGVEPGKTPPLDEAINFYHPEDRDIVSSSVESARTTGKPYTFQARLVRKDSEVRHTEAVARVEYDLSGKPVALFGVFRDRTDEEKMQAELRKARDEARAHADAKSDFLAKMSHEIRTPMNGVLGFAELLGNSELNPIQRRHVDLIADSGKTLQSLLNDILDLSKIEAGHMTVKPEATDIGHVINRVAQMTEPMAREKGLEVERVVDSALPMKIMVDGLRLRQIITNLMHNAVRFTDTGKIRLSALRRNGRLEIEVADTGIGIDAVQYESIFSAFSQADDHAESNVVRGGTGLGLAICRQLAELMDGTLSVQSIVGTGSNFILSLPLIEAEESSLRSASDVRPRVREPVGPRRAMPTNQFASRRVLLAEDFDINRELMSQMARQIGLTLTMAEDGEEAVRMIEKARDKGEPFELILMDVRMPKLDGLQATRLLRERGFDQAGLPIIALTANAFEDDIQACLAVGMQEHLGKPISIDTLKNAVERWLPDDRKHAA